MKALCSRLTILSICTQPKTEHRSQYLWQFQTLKPVQRLLRFQTILTLELRDFVHVINDMVVPCQHSITFNCHCTVIQQTQGHLTDQCFFLPDPLYPTWVSFITTTLRRRCTCHSRTSGGWWEQSKRLSRRRSSRDLLSSSECGLGSYDAGNTDILSWF